MKNSEFKVVFDRRIFNLAIKVIRMSFSLPNSTEWIIIKKQIVKSATSIGANYREANHARSIADFRSKISISESEAGETTYWLEVIINLRDDPGEDILELYKEAKEILSIFVAISKKLKQTNTK